VTPLVTFDASDPIFPAFVCGEEQFAARTLSIIIAFLVTCDQGGVFEVIITI
jgi:hypothetical protein